MTHQIEGCLLFIISRILFSASHSKDASLHHKRWYINTHLTARLYFTPPLFQVRQIEIWLYLLSIEIQKHILYFSKVRIKIRAAVKNLYSSKSWKKFINTVYRIFPQKTFTVYVCDNYEDFLI